MAPLHAGPARWVPRRRSPIPRHRLPRLHARAGHGTWRSEEPEGLFTSLELEAASGCVHALRISRLRIAAALGAAALEPLPALLGSLLALIPAPVPGVGNAVQNSVTLDAELALAVADERGGPAFRGGATHCHAFLLAGVGRVAASAACVLELTGTTLEAVADDAPLLYGLEPAPGAELQPSLSLFFLSKCVERGEWAIVRMAQRLQGPGVRALCCWNAGGAGGTTAWRERRPGPTPARPARPPAGKWTAPWWAGTAGCCTRPGASGCCSSKVGRWLEQDRAGRGCVASAGLGFEGPQDGMPRGGGAIEAACDVPCNCPSECSGRSSLGLELGARPRRPAPPRPRCPASACPSPLPLEWPGLAGAGGEPCPLTSCPFLHPQSAHWGRGRATRRCTGCLAWPGC